MVGPEGKDSGCRVVFPAREQAALEPYEPDRRPLGDDEVEGVTVTSLVSSGTELALFKNPPALPWVPGYAAVFRVSAVGRAVKDVAPGDYAFCLGAHQSRQRFARKDIVPLPPGLAVEKAPFARMANMALSAIATTAARPPQRVFVNGLGLIGNLTAQAVAACGYETLAGDPSEARRRHLDTFNVAATYAAVPETDEAVAGRVALFIDCTGKEQDALAGCRLVAKGGEVVLTGVPWSQRSEHTAHDVMSVVFHRYVRLRSGWEWELPLYAGDAGEPSIYGNLATALRWLADGRLRVDGLYETIRPDAAPDVYRRIAERRREALSTLIDWRGFGEA